jgi:hypothetical protein
VADLKRRLLTYQLSCAVITVFSIVFVGIAALMSGSKTTHRQATNLQIVFHIVVRTLSKSFQAIAMLLEKQMMNLANLTAVELTGLTGIWSLSLASTFLLPFEDMHDTVSIQSGLKK